MNLTKQISELTDKIFNGDCLELLRSVPDDSVDLIVSSPPYNLGKSYEAKRALRKGFFRVRPIVAARARKKRFLHY